MPQDADTASEKKPTAPGVKSKAREEQSHWFTTPQPIKRLFDKFPLITYASNELPQRSPKSRDQHALYIFTTEEGAKTGAPSFNPSCLKWQTYLKFHHIPFITIPSNNHASPTGALPFLLPATPISSPSTQSAAIPSNRIERWTRDIAAQEKQNTTAPKPAEHNDLGKSDNNDPEKEMRQTAYLSLLTHRIRPAYLHALYLSPASPTIYPPLYIHPLTHSPLPRLHLSHTLRSTATSEILKTTPSQTINPATLYKEADKAWEALSALLGEEEYFGGKDGPGILDACVFAYTNVLLGFESGVGEGVRRWGNLVAHRERVLGGWF